MRRQDQGFTLIELMIVVAIAAIATVLGFVSLNSRMKASSLEQAASQLESDLSYARSAALLKGCRTRLIFCNNRDCTAPDVVASGACPTGGSANCVLSQSGGIPAQYYAILRYSQNISNTDSCFTSEAVANALDGFDYWDFDRRPQPIPKGVALINIYSGAFGDLSDADWNSSVSGDAGESIWFDTEGELHSPLVANALVPDTSLAYRIVFQAQHEDCVVTSSENCLGFLVSIPVNGGTAKTTRCNLGTSRTGDNTNGCYP